MLPAKRRWLPLCPKNMQERSESSLLLERCFLSTCFCRAMESYEIDGMLKWYNKVDHDCSSSRSFGDDACSAARIVDVKFNCSHTMRC